ncbi:nucleotidyltransferase domain-containing protein [Thiomicrospira microaerophila]|uniref:nucleotidyltransferase family protein n=1 Tax=Thiomicrospira microaerophila TaxID=406020 RepID=UPI00200CA3E1|nr:nucleotidyltransferase domain-containing protein [Thiomicrospira microaerophila]UQB41253.1 nucleotidyltransferase domain-containing protein [Thiomicrospira microaerophila]
MRLSVSQLEIIKHFVSRVFEKEQGYQLWLFGSQMDDAVKGGDVDLCLIADMEPEPLLQIKLQLRPKLEEALDIPVDLVTQSQQRPIKTITQQAIENGLRLL